MRDLFRIVEEPRRCSYLHDQRASLDLRAVAGITPTEYRHLLERGWRRFGWQFFRPACQPCKACKSVRALAKQFTPTAGQRRVWRKNEQVRAELHPLFVVPEMVKLLNSYQRFMHEQRGWALQAHSAESYHEMFLSGHNNLGRQWLYFDNGRLIGVAMMDHAPETISLVYFFHDPAWRAQSPGTYSVLNQLFYAQANGLPHAYLGYWIEECQSMNYKNRFRPYEMLEEYVSEDEQPVWR